MVTLSTNYISATPHRLISDFVVGQLRRTIPDQYIAILLVGAAARNELTIGPDGTILSDMDILVVLPNRHLFSAVLKEKQNRKITSEIECEVTSRYGIGISIGYATALKNYWSMATPLMWELRENAVVLEGNINVKQWPNIEDSKQIPEWEGIRLLVNRICELLGAICQSSGSNNDLLQIQYSCIKLALACSEAIMIFTHSYRSTYKERQCQHNSISSYFTAPYNDLILLAYQAKLGQSFDFYRLNVNDVIKTLIQCAIAVLKNMGITENSDWEKRGRSERPYYIGLFTDFLFFVENLLHGNIVTPRHAIMAVYRDAMVIANKIANTKGSPYEENVFVNCRELYFRFKNTPQFVGIIEKDK